MVKRAAMSVAVIGLMALVTAAMLEATLRAGQTLGVFQSQE